MVSLADLNDFAVLGSAEGLRLEQDHLLGLRLEQDPLFDILTLNYLSKINIHVASLLNLRFHYKT
jgi:hypothetical protein